MSGTQQAQTASTITNEPVSYSSGGGFSYSSGGSSSAPKPPQVYSSQLLQQNFTSAAERDKAENIYRQEQARQQQIAFSKTGGLVTPGQTSTYFKVRSQDVKTIHKQ